MARKNLSEIMKNPLTIRYLLVAPFGLFSSELPAQNTMVRGLSNSTSIMLELHSPKLIYKRIKKEKPNYLLKGQVTEKT